MILLNGNDLARYFGSDVLFENIQIEIQDDSRIGLVGRNGAGKSTLLKILCGIEEADAGKISMKRGIKLGYLAQNTQLQSSETVWKEMIKSFLPLMKMEERMRDLELVLGIDSENQESVLKEYDQLQHDFKEQNGYGFESETRSVLHGFRFDESYYGKKISELSGGQRTRLAMAKLLLEKPEVLVLDEPTNHLDIETLTWLETYLQGYKGGLLIVSHDRYFLDKVTKTTLELSRRRLKKYQGNYSKYLQLKAKEYENELKEFEKQQTEIAKLEDFVNRNLARQSTTKRAQSRRKQLEKMEVLETPQGDEKSVHFGFYPNRISGNVVLTIEGADVGYVDVLSENIQMDIRRKEAIALVGPNGVGKSTLLKSIVGEIPFLKGKATLGTNVDIGYYDQEQSNLSGTKTVLKEVWDEHPTVPEKEIRTLLGGFLFTKGDVEKTIPLLSGGEKARVALAKLSMEADNFLILDEPTNHLDIDNKEVLENALIDFEGTLLFVSHDRYFINRIATKVVELSEEGGKTYLGDYDYYLEKKEEERLIEELEGENKKDEKANSSNFDSYKQSKEDQKKIRSIKRSIEKLEDEMAILEEELQEVNKGLEEASMRNHLDEITKLHLREQEIQEQLNVKMEAWETESLKLDE
ncbi:MAG: ABC-F family ATP-binding cassette domain-containing protein [Streptococcaceae bacterium]|jgi:ATP-binding cassette subfamily F protein 3|nr:ABC-F family ATP-binding cassette domain-containing protein [Streptococcaceae bacterium]